MSVLFDTGRFIAEIQKHPPIYDFACPQYTDKNAKDHAWERICENIVPKWHSLNYEVKNVEEKILRSKWRNIRDYFMKELKLQKMHRNRNGGKKRKKYMYFEQLQFLMPNTEQGRSKKKARTKKQPQTKYEEIDVDEDPLQTSNLMEEQYEVPLTHEDLAEDYPNVDDNISNANVIAANDPVYAQFPKSICETSMASTTEDYPDSVTINTTLTNKATIVDDEDYDKMFLLSLLPTMRRLNEDKKLDVRIQMQQVMAQALKGNKS